MSQFDEVFCLLYVNDAGKIKSLDNAAQGIGIDPLLTN